MSRAAADKMAQKENPSVNWRGNTISKTLHRKNQLPAASPKEKPPTTRLAGEALI
jgi:hypothetical protein